MKPIVNAVLLGTAFAALSAYAADSSTGDAITVAANPGTAAEHVRAAEFFTQKAAALESDADWHDKMPRLPYGATFPKNGPNPFAHCRALRDQLTAQAKEARAAALAHYKMAALADK